MCFAELVIRALSIQFTIQENYGYTRVSLRGLHKEWGLHRETVLVKLSVLEAEIRRRLWWQISVLDARSADRAAVGVPSNRVF